MVTANDDPTLLPPPDGPGDGGRPSEPATRWDAPGAPAPAADQPERTRWHGTAPPAPVVSPLDARTWWTTQPGAATTRPAATPRPAGERLPSGSRLGPWQLDAELGRGGMGAVWRATDVGSGRVVALKLILELAAQDAPTRARFLREGELAARVDHPGIVRVHAAGETDGLPWLATELVEGARSLTAAAAGRPLAERAALVRDAARALGAAHARGIVHRDVKPDNLLVDARGRVRVTDFGLATAGDVQRLTLTGTVMGTPAYMAPEQLEGDRAALGPWTDVWALGAVLHETLTGERPFGTGSPFEVGARVLQGARFRRPREVTQAIPEALEDVVLRALTVEASERWPDGEAMARALDAALGGPPAATRAPGRRPGPLAAGALAALALAVGLAWKGRCAPSDPAPGASSPGPVVASSPGPVVASSPAPVPAPATGPPPAPTDAAPAGPVAPVWSVTRVLSWGDARPEPTPDLELGATRGVERRPGKLNFHVRGESFAELAFMVRDEPAWVQVKLGHLATKGADGRKVAFVDLHANGQLLARRHAPTPGGEVFDLTSCARVGHNVLRLVLHRDSLNTYWLTRVEVRYGTGPPPGR